MQLRQQLLALLQQNDVWSFMFQLWIKPADRPHQIRNMSGNFHTAEAAANDNNGEQPLTHFRIRLGRGGFKVADHIVAHDDGEHFGDASETDVITFPYGEILICPAVARDRAGEFGQRVEEEVLLYGLHGLLHLAGFEDGKPIAAKKMMQAQQILLQRAIEKAG